MRIASTLVALVLSLSAPAIAQPKSEPYVWRSVTIKANGFINGIVFSPAERGLIYIHTDMGGAYRHDAATDRWICLTDWIQHDDWSLNQMGVETMAVDPTDANRVYAGVGTYMGPSAVLRSTDRGRTWQRTNVPFAMNGNGSARNAGERMNVDPNFPARLIYGTRTKGLWASDDSGATWHAIESFPATGDQSSNTTKDAGIVWTLFDKSSGREGAGQPTPVIYVGICTQKEQKVFRTADAGKTWAAIASQPGGNVLPTRAAITPDGKTMYLTYIVGDGFPGPHNVVGGSVFRIDELSSNQPRWTEIAPAKGHFGFSGVAIDPTSPQTVYVTTLNRYGNPPDDIYRSTDAGESWSPLNVTKHRDDSAAAYIADHSIHWVGDVQVDPHDRNLAMFTTGYGIYRTSNLTDASPTWAFYNEGFEQSAVLELVSPNGGGAHLLSAIGDRDGYRHENFDESPKYGRFGQVNDYGQKVSHTLGTCHDVDVALDKPEIVVRVGGPAQYSNDGGITWTPFATEPAPATQQAQGSRRRRGGRADGSIAISRDGRRAVWAPRRSAVVLATRTDDGTWSDFAPANGIAAGDSMLAADLVDASTFYARTNQGLFISTDGGTTWTCQNDKLPDRAHWLRATPGHKGHLWLTAGDEGKLGLHRSTDDGKTWRRVRAQEVTVAKQVGLGAAAAGKDYPAVFIGGTVGDRRGFFRSDDEGDTWVQINDDTHHYGNVTVINGDPRVFGRLYVGTNGRGILYAEPAGNSR
jgi:photosystem II stability/assembly factor-like uncharacterized protein